MLKNSISPGTRSMLHALHSTKSSNSKNAITLSVIFTLRANGRNNSQHCCDNMFGVVAPCWQWCANGCNNSQQCWEPQCIVGRIQPLSLFLKTMHNEHAWPQQCWKSCANGSNIVALRFGDHGRKEMLGVVG